MRQLLLMVLAAGFGLATTVRRIGRLVFRPITVGVRALVLRDDEVLLVRQHGSREWVLPGGGAGRGEHLRNGAEREALEETGVCVTASRLLGMYTTLHEGLTNHVAVFVCRPVDPAVEPDPDRIDWEIAAARYFRRSTLPPGTHPMVRRRLAEYDAGKYGLDGPF